MSEAISFDPVPLIAEELALPLDGVAAVCRLLDEGGTVPFIARYRKEATGGLDEVQIRTIQERREYLTELEERRVAILESIESQGRLTAELRAALLACRTKAELEDLYLPYKPKRRTRATIAREKGLEPLAERILSQPLDGAVQAEAATFVSVELDVVDVEAALAGARDIVAERVAETAPVRQYVRKVFFEEGFLGAEVHAKKQEERTKFEQYYGFREKIADIPSHRYLALRRGEREKVLKVTLEADADGITRTTCGMVGLKSASPFAKELELAVADAYQRLLAPSVENDVRLELKERSDEAAVSVFASNLRNLLLAAPLGEKVVLGVDPGIRTGCKCVAIDATGKYLENCTVFLGQGEQKEEHARVRLLELIKRYQPEAIAVGNGTGGREAEAFVRGVLKSEGLTDIIVVAVNEAGASVYSASDVAREEFPSLDVTIRGSISISRRLQDPLAELVKIEPRSIGVGQYQHDVHQPMLSRKLEQVVESCVNQVGVEVNTASAPLLSQVAGVSKTVAQNIVKYRDSNGAFASRADLCKVPKLGPRTFEQAAGFLRIRGGAHPLDRSAVHPERYGLVEQMARDLGVGLGELVGNSELVGRIDIRKYMSDDVGEPTLKDILDELRKPGRDPRADFEPPKFRDDVQTLTDLAPGMSLEGVITNVTAFGAFVDIGVHQDGLVHISQLSDRYVKDPHEVAQVGDKIKVRVLEVDVERKRISLTAKSGEGAAAAGREPREQRPARSDGARGADAGDRARGPKGDRGGAGSSGAGKRGPGAPPPSSSKEKFSNNPFAALLKNTRR